MNALTCGNNYIITRYPWFTPFLWVIFRNHGSTAHNFTVNQVFYVLLGNKLVVGATTKEVHIMIWFLWAKHVFPTKIYCQLTVYGHSIIVVQYVRQWCRVWKPNRCPWRWLHWPAQHNKDTCMQHVYMNWFWKTMSIFKIYLLYWSCPLEL